MSSRLTAVDICAGGGGQSLGLEAAGFSHVASVDNDGHAVETLRLNRPQWNPVLADVREWMPPSRGSVDLLAGGVPCPPFSRAGTQLGADDERDLFPAMLSLVDRLAPRAVLVENVRGLLDAKFDAYRTNVLGQLKDLGYRAEWRLVNACEFGVPQSRTRSVLIGLTEGAWPRFGWPVISSHVRRPSVGECLQDLMAANGWEGAHEWASRAVGPAPTLVGGSKKHGGADLGPTRARREWLSRHGVDGRSLANSAPMPGFVGAPKLTVRMAARIQGFPDVWEFSGGKTAQYRQIGNAFPPPVATALGRSIAFALRS